MQRSAKGVWQTLRRCAATGLRAHTLYSLCSVSDIEKFKAFSAFGLPRAASRSSALDRLRALVTSGAVSAQRLPGTLPVQRCNSSGWTHLVQHLGNGAHWLYARKQAIVIGYDSQACMQRAGRTSCSCIVTALT